MTTTFSNWRVILRHYSSIALSLITTFSAVWAASPEFQAVLPAKWVVAVNVGLAVLGFIGKFVKQDLPPNPENPK